MKVGIIGSGGREHAICETVKKSNKIDKIFCFPGNAGTKLIAENIDINVSNFKEIHKTCEEKKGLVMKSLRAALFGTLNGPDLIKSWVLLSRFSKDRSRMSRFL